MAYAKLFSTLVNSTVWLEDNETRILWITMLAMADKHGEVKSSVPGLCKQAQISLEGCLKALAKFQVPDPLSTTKEAEGRRIEPIEGGWALINYAKYRHMASVQDKQEKTAERQRRFKERKRNGDAEVTQGNDQALPDNADDGGRSRTGNASPPYAESKAKADPTTESESAAAASSVAAREEISDDVRAEEPGATDAVIVAEPHPFDPNDPFGLNREDSTEVYAPHGFEEDGITPIRTTPMPVDDFMPMPAVMPVAPPPPPPPVQVKGDTSDEARAFNAFNQCARLQGWDQAMFLNTTVRFKLQARLAQAAQIAGGDPIAGWTQVLMKAANAAFLRTPDGKAQRWFDLDFLLDEEKFRRLMEGKYDERRNAAGNSGPTTGSAVAALARLSQEDPG